MEGPPAQEPRDPRANYDLAVAYQSLLLQEQIFAIDIGATNIKFSHVNDLGVLVRGVRRRPTPYPCSPARLVEFLDERIAKSGCRRVGVGFPGEFRDGHVVQPGNLSRPGGVATEKDPDLDALWRGFALQDALREKTGREVRVVNDATMAALGCIEGEGTELVLTLGTGLGLALARSFATARPTTKASGNGLARSTTSTGTRHWWRSSKASQRSSTRRRCT